MSGVVFGLAAVAGLLVFVTVFVRSLRAEHKEKGWVPGQATVLEARPWALSRADAPHGTYQVRARLAAADGREVSGWAEGIYARGDTWVGSMRPAWHDPVEIHRFRLLEPRGVFVGFLRLLPGVLVLVLVLAVFAGVALLATR